MVKIYENVTFLLMEGYTYSVYNHSSKSFDPVPTLEEACLKSQTTFEQVASDVAESFCPTAKMIWDPQDPEDHLSEMFFQDFNQEADNQQDHFAAQLLRNKLQEDRLSKAILADTATMCSPGTIIQPTLQRSSTLLPESCISPINPRLVNPVQDTSKVL